MADAFGYKPPVVSLTQAEVDEMKQLIVEGKIPRDAFEQVEEATEKNVFGIDVKHDRHGNPIEQGIGSAAQPSRNSIEAYKAHQMGNKFGPEKGFEENLARMEAEFAEFEKKRAARNAAAKAKRRKAA